MNWFIGILIKHDFGEIALLKLYRIYTCLKVEQRRQIGVTTPYIRILKTIDPAIVGFDSLFSKWGFWADGIWMLAKKKG